MEHTNTNSNAETGELRTSQRLRAKRTPTTTTTTNITEGTTKKKEKEKKPPPKVRTQSRTDFLTQKRNNKPSHQQTTPKAKPKEKRSSTTAALKEHPTPPINQNKTEPPNPKNKKENKKKKKTKNIRLPKVMSIRVEPDLLNNPQTPQLGFVENVDFIRLEDSGDESKPNQSNGKRPITTTPNRSGRNRGTKRKFDASTITEEQANSVRKKKGSIITPWFDKLSWRRRNVQQMLTAEIGSFVGYIQPTYEEHQLRIMIIEMIRKVVQSRWADADVEPFGSFGSKLYLPVGDIDLVIISTQMMSQQKSKVLYKLAPLIRENNIGQDVVVIAKAKVPIIKFKTIHGNINVDISINQTNGLVALKKVNELFEDLKHLSPPPQSSRQEAPHSSRRDGRPTTSNLEPSSSHEESIRRTVDELGAAKCLVLVIKSVLKQRGMNEVYTGGLGSYSIICLVVSFLQLHPKIQRGDIDPNKNLGVLLLEFFELYGKHFNFDDTGISVRKGGYYFSKSRRGWQRERQPYLLSIEDPADETNDISSNSHNILSVRTVFSGAFDLLSATLYHRHSLQASRSRETDKYSSPRPLLSVPVPKQKATEEEEGHTITKDPMDESLLGEIMGVTKELVEHRKKNIKLFYSGTLHRLLQLSPPTPAGGSTETVPTHKNGTLAREDYRNEHASGSLRPEGSRTDPSRTRRGQEEESDARRQHLSTKDSNRPGTIRRVVRYDFDEIDSPCPPKKRETEAEKRKKRKGKKSSNVASPQPLWVEDLEPTDVQILKRNLFSTDPLSNEPVPSVEHVDETRAETLPDHLDGGNKATGKSSVEQKKRYSDEDDRSPEGKNQPRRSDEIDEQMDSKYRSIQKSRVNQLTLNLVAHASSSPSGSKSRTLPHLYVDDEEDSESDFSEDNDSPKKDGNTHTTTTTTTTTKTGESNGVNNDSQDPEKNNHQVVPLRQESLPGTPEGSPSTVLSKGDVAIKVDDRLLDLLPGTPPSPPASSPPPIAPTSPRAPRRNVRLDSHTKQELWLAKAFSLPPDHQVLRDDYDDHPAFSHPA